MNNRGFRGSFRPHSKARGRGNPSPNESLQASLCPPVGGRLCSFRRDWLANKCSDNVLNIITNGYIQSIHLKTKFSQSSPESIRLQGPSKRTSSGLLYPVSFVKERNRKGGKCKISWVLQSPVSSPQASPKVEASNRPKQAQHLSACRKVQNGNTRVHQGLSDSRGMGVIDTLIRRLPSHPHPPKLKEVPMVLPQGSGVPVYLPFGLATAPPGLYNDCKRSAADGPDKGNQTSPVPGLGPVSGRSTSKHPNSGRPDPVLRVDNKSREIRTKTYSSVFVCGLRILSRFSPCKTHSREMAQTSRIDPTTQVKTCFDCKMFDVANWVACLN